MSKTKTTHPKLKSIGKLITIYRDRPLRWKDLFITFIPGGMSVLLPLLYGIARKGYAQEYYGPTAAEIWSKPWFILSGIALVAYIILVVRRIRRAQQIVRVHKDGIIIILSKRKRYIFNWNQLSGVASTTVQPTFLGLKFKARHRIVIYPIKGSPISFNDRVPNIPTLVKKIKTKIYPRLMPNYRKRFAEGDPLYFGPITFKQDSLQVRDQVIPWNQITNINVKDGLIMVESSTNQPLKIPSGKIPNIEILIQLLKDGVET
ncbi:MAG: DUF6585 family protein [Chloroflexota bacterium]